MKRFSFGRRLSPAMVVACISLFVALSGASYAAIALPRNSVGTLQLKKNAVTSVKVRDGSLRAGDFGAGQLPAGPQGPQGPAGPASLPALTYVRSGFISVPASSFSGFQHVACPSGQRPVGGGLEATSYDVDPYVSAPGASSSVDNPTGWVAAVTNYTSTIRSFRVYAICAPAGSVAINY